MEIRKTRHAAFTLVAHLVFVTKYRRKVFTDEHLVSLEVKFGEIMKSMDGKLLEFNGEEDHVHLLVEYKPDLSISKIVNNLKGTGSKFVRKHHPEIKEIGNHLWTRSYFASSATGVTIDVLRDYIENQDRPEW